MHWLLTAHGAFTQNMTIVTAYETLGEDGLLHSMNETEVEAIFTSAELVPTVAKVAKDCPSLKYVIYQGEAKESALESVKTGTVEKVLSMDELVKLGKENPKEARAPEPEDLCCIQYTSGSTGAPKGVMLSHKNIVGASKFKVILFHLCISSQQLTKNISCWRESTTWPSYHRPRQHDGLLAVGSRA